MVTRKISDLQPVLQDASLTGETVVYTVGPRPDGVTGDVTTIYPKMLGREFPKTYGHYHVPPHSETYSIKSGWAMVLTQKVDKAGQLLDFNHQLLKKGESFTVPEDYGHVLVNVGNEPLIAWDDWDPTWAKHTYGGVTAKRGFAYYVVADQGRQPQLVQNPRYF